MPAMAGMAMPMVEAWTAADFAAMLAMWSVMMAAMMLPAAIIGATAPPAPWQWARTTALTASGAAGS